MTIAIQLSGGTYALLRRRSLEMRREPGDLADELLRASLAPLHPYIETVKTRSGPKAMIKGTRTSVATVIGYIQLGETPESIVAGVLPHLSVAQVHDALGYFHAHSDEIEAELTLNRETASQVRLQERVGEAQYRRLTGTAASA
jgi:uncharacterized protein (DUF433 family)